MNKRRWTIGLLAGVMTLSLGLLAGTAPRALAESYTPTADYIDLAAEPAPLGEGEYTLAVMGDIQKAVAYYPEFVQSSMEWLAREKDELRLQYLLTLGDIVDDSGENFAKPGYPTYQEQFATVDRAFRVLDDAGLPYSLVMGNHDYQDMVFYERDTTHFNETFPVSRYENWPTFGGALNGDIENTYHLFTAGGTKYLIFAIGHNPTDETTAWCNEIADQYADRKIIVTTHGYIAGGANYTTVDYPTDMVGERTPRGDKLWDLFVRKHENIIMVLAGHEIGTSRGNVVQSIQYGDHGNAVRQFIVNPQEEQFGGAGLVLLMRFRADGEVECNYYCPYFDKYFRSVNQFQFYLNLVEPNLSAPERQMGGRVENRFDEDYAAYSTGDESWQDKTEAWSNVRLSNEGLTLAAAGSGSATYRFQAEQRQIFSGITVHFDAVLTGSGDPAVAAGLDFYVAKDGGLFRHARHFDADAPAGTTRTFCMDEEVRDSKSLALKVVLSGTDPTGTVLRSLQVTMKGVTVTAAAEEAGFGNSYDFSRFSHKDVTAWCEDVYQNMDLLIWKDGALGYLGTGREDDYAGAKAFAVWKYESGAGRTFETLNLRATGRLLKNDRVQNPWALRVSVSVDGGQTWQLCAEEQTGAKTNFSYDLSAAVRGETDAFVKLELWGNYWHTVGLKTLDIAGTYRCGLTYETGAGTAAANPTSYVPGDSFALQSPTPPAHCRFEGWYETPDFSGEKVTEIAATDCGAKTLYAKYAPIAHNIVYHLNGGKNAAANPDTFAEGEGLTLAAPTRTGYSFAGWYERADFSGDAVTNLASGTTKDVELYAKWAKNYRITYVLNGGTLADRQESFSEIEEVTLGEPAREGYVFAGWYESADFAGERVERLEAGTARAVTLYAKWETAEGGSGGCGSAAEASLLGLSLLTLLGAGLALKRKRAK